MDRVVGLLRDRADVCEIVAATILTLPHRRLMSHENLVSFTRIIDNVARLFKITRGEVITADLLRVLPVIARCLIARLYIRGSSANNCSNIPQPNWHELKI